AISGEAVPGECFVTVVDVGGQPARPSRPVRVEDTDSRVVIDTGALRAELGRPGTEDGLLVSVVRDGVVVAEDVRLVSLLQDTIPEDGGAGSRRRFRSRLDGVTVEQSGPVRAVVRLEGQHLEEGGARSWLPFTVRVVAMA